ASKKIERHVKTGALQIVESPIVIQEQAIVRSPGTPGLFADYSDDYLLSLGLPPDWLPVIRQVKSEEALCDQIIPKLPDEIAERLFNLASGELVTPPAPVPSNRPVTESADTLRNFFLLENDSDLHRLLAAPLATWIAFLHPSQKKLATGTFNGP